MFMVYEKMTKAELIRQLKSLQARSGSTSTADESQHILRELQIHQAELEAQNRELREAQQQLESSRDRYTDLYDFAPICYASLDEYAMLRRVRSLEAKRGVETPQQIPAIALTALTGDEDRLRALSAGFQSHIAKPAEPAELMLVIANIAGLWRHGAPFK
jgi:CheY-like chemotaxis protein